MLSPTRRELTAFQRAVHYARLYIPPDDADAAAEYAWHLAYIERVLAETERKCAAQAEHEQDRLLRMRG